MYSAPSLDRCSAISASSCPCHQGQRTDRAAGAVLDLERRAENHRTGGWQLIQVRQTLQTVAPRAMHVVVARIGRPQMKALPGIGADGFGAEADHVALIDEETNRIHGR